MLRTSSRQIGTRSATTLRTWHSSLYASDITSFVFSLAHYQQASLFLLKFLGNAVSINKIKTIFYIRTIMQELLTAITYPIVWLICSYLLNIESGLAKLLISLTAAILVYVLIGIKVSKRENEKDKED
jgi:hypothetical protein